MVDTIVKDELGEYLGPDVWEQTTTALNLSSRPAQPQESDEQIEKRKLALMKSGFNVTTSTSTTQARPVNEVIYSDTEVRSDDSLSHQVSERERLDLNSPPVSDSHTHHKRDVKLTHVKEMSPQSLDNIHETKVHFDGTTHDVQDQPHSEKKNSNSEPKSRSGSSSKSGKSKIDPNSRRTRKKEKILPRLANKELHGAGHIALDEDLVSHVLIVFCNRVSSKNRFGTMCWSTTNRIFCHVLRAVKCQHQCAITL